MLRSGLTCLLAASLLLAGCNTTPTALGPTDTLSSYAQTAVAEGAQVIEMDWRDENRQRDVPVRLYWPAHAVAGQAVPLVVYSHGIGGSRRGYSYLGAYFARQGYASLHVQHVGSDRQQVWMGNPLQLVARLQAAAQESEAISRVADVKFALDQLLHSERAGLIDADRIVAAGHSYGANTTLLLAGAQVTRQGHTLDLRDPRFKAAIVISAPPFYGDGDVRPIAGPIAIPTLHITATEDVIRVPGYFSDASDRLALFDATGHDARKVLAVFEGGSHSMFTDRGITGGTALNPRAKQATQELALAFLNDVLDGKPDGLRHWSAQYQDILARWQSPYGQFSAPAVALKPETASLAAMPGS